ncbi:MAG: M28 family peptidase [Anaerolineae bacterium]|nr:M28 family peptidase [Anaerolineae bacterium]
MDDQTISSALQHVQAIVEKIGPRPAGSEAERKAIDYVRDRLISWGYAPQVQEVSFAPLPLFYPLNVLVGVLLVVSAFALEELPRLTIWLPFIFMLIPRVSKYLIRSRPTIAKSQNLIAYTSQDESVPLLVLCAHVDTARTIVLRNRMLRKLYFRAMTIIQRTAFVVAFMSFVIVFGFTFPPGFIWVVRAIAVLVGGAYILADLLNQFAHRNIYSPGAYDNASGVGVVLELAEYFSNLPPNRLRLGFLFTGAEETGLHGADVFARYLVEKGIEAAVLNFDMVGAGRYLYYVEREGSIFPQSTSRELNQLLRTANPDIKPFWYTLRSGDFSPFLRYKIPATSLQTGGSESVELVYHNVDDTLAVIEEHVLEAVVETVKKFVELVQYSDWAIADKR